MLNQQQLREILASYPQAESICAETGRVYYGSQRMTDASGGDHYVVGPGIRDQYRNIPTEAPGAKPCTDVVFRWQLGLPTLGV